MGEDDKMKLNQAVVLDLKMAITVLTIIIGLAGFYYTTELRLDRLEAASTSVQPSGDVESLKKQIQSLKKRVKKLEKK